MFLHSSRIRYVTQIRIKNNAIFGGKCEHSHFKSKSKVRLNLAHVVIQEFVPLYVHKIILKVYDKGGSWNKENLNELGKMEL